MSKPAIITSPANPLLKEVRRAILRGAPTSDGYCVAETFHLLEEALASKCEVITVLAAESARPAVESHLRGRSDIRLVILPDPVFQHLSGTETAQGVMALVRLPDWRVEDVFASCPLVLIMDGLQDPGNAGTITRTAEAFGATGVLFLKGTVSPFNSKTLRASAGSLFRIPFLHGIDTSQASAALLSNQTAAYASVPPTAGSPSHPLSQVDFTRRCAIVIGSEGHGVSQSMRSASVSVSIPTVGVESLNAAVAAAILLYEARRQRSGDA